MNISTDLSTDAPTTAETFPANALSPHAHSPLAPSREGLSPLPFGPAPLAEGEDAEAYDELLLRVSSGVKPHDILEEIWVRDVVDLTWETLRLRRLKAAVLTMSARKVLTENGEVHRL